MKSFMLLCGRGAGVMGERRDRGGVREKESSRLMFFYECLLLRQSYATEMAWCRLFFLVRVVFLEQ